MPLVGLPGGFNTQLEASAPKICIDAGQHRGHQRCGNSSAPLEFEEELTASRSGAKPFLLVLFLRLLLLILGRTRDSVVEGGVFGLPFWTRTPFRQPSNHSHPSGAGGGGLTGPGLAGERAAA